MHEEFDPITWLQPKMLANGLGNGGLALAGDCGFHGWLLLDYKCNTTAFLCSQALTDDCSSTGGVPETDDPVRAWFSKR